MKALFIGRLDDPPKRGGDSIQMEQYSRVLRKSHQINFLGNASKLNDYDILHFFNILKINDLLKQYRDYKKSGKNKKILHLIYPSQLNLSNFNSNQYYHKSFFLNENLKFLYKSFKTKKFTVNDLSCFLRSNKNKILDFVYEMDYLHFLSLTEKEWFETDFNIQLPENKVLTFENGITDELFDYDSIKPYENRDIDILIPGRIEPQKNSLEILNSLSEFKNRKIVFCGQLNNYFPEFSHLFLKNLEENKNVLFMGNVNHSEMSRLYGSSKIVLSQSLSEVSPLIEYEALWHKCVMIGTSFSASHFTKYNPSKFFYQVNPFNTSGLQELLTNIFTNNIYPEFKEFPHIKSWEEVLEPLIRIYQGR